MSVRKDEIHVATLRELAEAHVEIARLTKALDEREADMHMRIRAGYDKTVADAWRAEVAKRDAEIARLTADLAAARAVPADVEAALSGAWADGYDEGRADALRRPEDHHRKKPSTRDATIAWGKAAITRAISDATAARGTVGGLLATEPVGSIVEFVSPDGMYHQAVVAGGRLLSRRWQHALSHSPGDWTLYAFWLDGAYLRLPARLVPAAEADADPSQRGPLPKGG